MPELPEVETVARLLAPDLVGRRIERVAVDWPRSLGALTPVRFRRAVVGTRVKGIRRRGKYLIFDLARGGEAAGVLVGHLRMSGRMHVLRASDDPGPWCRVSFALSGGKRFDFVDVRKFGRLEFAPDERDLLPSLGPEPLEDGFTADWFRLALRGRKRRLKALLLDQSFVAGLGNIYVDEALFTSGLHPKRRADKVPKAKADQLHGVIRHTLSAAIEREGSSFDSFYRTPEGQPGSYQQQFLVYGRTGRPCRRCGRAIKKLVVAQRGTHICTRCQPAPRV